MLLGLRGAASRILLPCVALQPHEEQKIGLRCRPPDLAVRCTGQSERCSVGLEGPERSSCKVFAASDLHIWQLRHHITSQALFGGKCRTEKPCFPQTCPKSAIRNRFEKKTQLLLVLHGCTQLTRQPVDFEDAARRTLEKTR